MRQPASGTRTPISREADVQSQKIHHKWGFGMSKIKPEIVELRRNAASRVEEFLANGTGSGSVQGRLQADLQELKGLFSRTWKHDQWDWFTVSGELGHPDRTTARNAAQALGLMGRALRDGDDASLRRAAKEFIDCGGGRHLAVYLSGKRQAAPGTGYLYILSTRENPTLLKIGYTERTVEERVAEINRATGIVTPFGVRRVWVLKQARQVEKEIHALLARYRVRADREFFDLSFRDACILIEDHFRGS